MQVLITLFVTLYPVIFELMGMKAPIDISTYILNVSVVCMLNHVIYEIQKRKI